MYTLTATFCINQKKVAGNGADDSSRSRSLPFRNARTNNKSNNGADGPAWRQSSANELSSVGAKARGLAKGVRFGGERMELDEMGSQTKVFTIGVDDDSSVEKGGWAAGSI